MYLLKQKNQSGSLKILLASDDADASPDSTTMTWSSYSKSLGPVLIKLNGHINQLGMLNQILYVLLDEGLGFCTSITSSQKMLMLLVYGPHSEQQSPSTKSTFPTGAKTNSSSQYVWTLSPPQTFLEQVAIASV